MNSLQILQDSIAAFAGAFFAFVFIKISDILRDFSKRKRENYNALVKIEYMTNEIYGLLSITTNTIDLITDHYNIARKGNVDWLSVNRFVPLNYDKTVIFELLNIDFINDLYSYFTDIEKHNLDIFTINGFKDSNQNARLDKKITSDDYLKGIEMFINMITEFRKFTLDLQNETLNITACCRALMDREMTCSMRVKNIFLQTRYDKEHNESKVKHLDELKNEITTTKKHSQDKIDGIINNKNMI